MSALTPPPPLRGPVLPSSELPPTLTLLLLLLLLLTVVVDVCGVDEDDPPVCCGEAVELVDGVCGGGGVLLGEEVDLVTEVVEDGGGTFGEVPRGSLAEREVEREGLPPLLDDEGDGKEPVMLDVIKESLTGLVVGLSRRDDLW